MLCMSSWDALLEVEVLTLCAWGEKKQDGWFFMLACPSRILLICLLLGLGKGENQVGCFFLPSPLFSSFPADQSIVVA